MIHFAYACSLLDMQDGMKMNGYNGSQCWDTSFAIQAVLEGGFASEFPELCKKTLRYLNDTQIRNDEASTSLV